MHNENMVEDEYMDGTYGECPPGTEFALVADSGGKTITGHNLDGTEVLLYEGMYRNGLPNGVLRLLVDLQSRSVILRIGDRDGDTSQCTIVIRPRRPDL